MNVSYHHKNSEVSNKYMTFFFAGGETRDDSFNIFTGSFIRLMKLIMEDDFEYIRGMYYKSPMMNVIWALNNAQKPIADAQSKRITMAAFTQIIDSGLSPHTHLIITSSSSGSIVAAQTACYLAEKNRHKVYFENPFHLVLGASMLSKESLLYRQLIHYQRDGIIGKIIYDEVQDEGDNSKAIGGISRLEAYSNAFGLLFPWFSWKFTGPSFLNTNPESGHIHRRRSQTVQKALDYIEVILIRNELAGAEYKEKAIAILKGEIN